MKYNPTPSKQFLTWGTLDEVPPKVFPSPYISQGTSDFWNEWGCGFILSGNRPAHFLAATGHLVLTGI